MADLDTLPFHDGHESPATRNGATGRKRCRKHTWGYWGAVKTEPHDPMPIDGPLWEDCRYCPAVRDPAASRRGRTSLRAGKDAERAIAKAYPGGKRTGHFGGPDDVLVGDLFIVQSKVRAAFPEWMWSELAKLPRSGGRIPTLIVSDRPGKGHDTRRMVVRMMADDVALLGDTP